MKKLYLFIKSYLGELMIIIGSGLSVFNILRFSHTGRLVGGLLPPLPSLDGELLNGVAYYYTLGHALLITLGVLLMVIGILMVRNKK